jgi:hypothetical protein
MPTRLVSADTLGSCECCRERFGRLEALGVPIPLGCRHVICIGCVAGDSYRSQPWIDNFSARVLIYLHFLIVSRCLRDDGSSCPICGVAYSKEQFQTLFELVAASPHYTPLPLEAEDIESVLRNRYLALNETTPLSMLRDIFKACNQFLKAQPRNKVSLDNYYCSNTGAYS